MSFLTVKQGVRCVSALSDTHDQHLREYEDAESELRCETFSERDYYIYQS